MKVITGVPFGLVLTDTASIGQWVASSIVPIVTLTYRMQGPGLTLLGWSSGFLVSIRPNIDGSSYDDPA